MKEKFYIMKIIIGAAMFTIAPLKASAMCPVCTVAVGAGLELSHWLGVDDSITGLWIGALAISVSWWTIDWLKRRKIKFPAKIITVPLIYVALIFYALWANNFLAIEGNALWGLDKIILSSIIGALGFFLTATWYFSIKRKNNNKPLFLYQKIVMTLGVLLALSGFFYFITK